jgi:hypothetical protein
MAANEEIGKLVLVLEAQIQDLQTKLSSAVKLVDDYEKTTDKTAKSSKKSWIDSAKATALGFFGVTTAVGTLTKAYSSIIKFGNYAIQQWNSQEDANIALATALGYTSQSLLDQASALQSTTRYADDQTQQAQALLGAWIKNDDEIRRLIPVIQDFAAAKSLDLLTATDLITKSIASETNALSRYGIRLDDNLTKEERAEQIIYKISKAYGGMAEALGKTDAGQITKVKNEISDLAEGIGKDLVPAQLAWNKVLKAGTGLIAGLLGDWKEIDKTQVWYQEWLKTAEGMASVANENAKKEVDATENKRKKLLAIMQQQLDDKLDFDKKAEERRKKQKEKYVKDELLELQFYEEKTKLLLAELSASYEDNKISIEDYYREKTALITDNAEKEIAILKQLESAEKNPIKAKDIHIKLLIREAQLKTELHDIDRERLDDIKKAGEAQKKLNDILREIDTATFSPSGEGKEAARQRETAALLENQKKQKDSILAIKKEGIDTEKALIEAKLMWEQQKEDLVLEHDKQRHQERLEVLGDGLKLIADEFQKYYDMRLSVVQTLQQAVEQAEQAGDTTRSASLRKQLFEAQQHARRMFYLTQTAAFAQATVQGALAVIKAYADGGPGAAVVAAAAVGLQLGNILAQTLTGPGFGDGGQVEGEAGKDVINARLTRKEFVHPVKSVEYYGTSVMEALRRRAIPKELFSGITNYRPHTPSIGAYSEGGLASTKVSQVNTRVSKKELRPLNITNIVDPNLLQQFLFSQQGQDAVVNVISMNNYSVKRSLSL